MSFKAIFPKIAGANPNPPPAVVTGIIEDIRIDIVGTPDVALINKYIFYYLGAAANTYGYLYAAWRSETSLEALVSVNWLGYWSVEITRLSATSLKAYYRGSLITTLPATTASQTNWDGYYYFKPSGYGTLSGWTYRKCLRFTGSADGDLTDYQIKLIVNRSSGTDSGNTVYLGTKCNADFSDLRFTSADGETLLSHWIEDITGTVATVWVKFDSIPDDPEWTDFFIYYGNSGASDTSDGDSVFIFFDDFSGDFSKWDAQPSGWSISGGKLIAPTSAWMYHAIDDYPNLSFRAKVTMATEDSTTMRIGVWNAAKNAYNSEWANFNLDRLQMFKTSEVSGGIISVTLTALTWYILDLVKLGSDWKIYLDDVLKDSEASWLSLTLAYIGLRAYGVVDTYFDNVILRKITANEPTISAWGSEEEL